LIENKKAVAIPLLNVLGRNTQKAKERNSGIIMDEIPIGEQDTFISNRKKLFSEAQTLVPEVSRGQGTAEEGATGKVTVGGESGRA
jgi:hypothetical protein